MNVFLWFLQIVLALHTVVGAIWKSSNSECTLPSLGAIPHVVWLGLIALEFLCAVGLIVPAIDQRLANLVPLAAACIGAEMLYFSGVHLASGTPSVGPVIYWLVVAAVCALVAYGRLVLAPYRGSRMRTRP